MRLSVFTRFLNLHPDSPTLLNNYANLLLDIGDLDTAQTF